MAALGTHALNGVELAEAAITDAPSSGSGSGSGADADVKSKSMEVSAVRRTSSSQQGEAHEQPEERYEDTPTDEDLHTLRRVSGKINWAAYTIAFCELCERFSYYGSSILYTNFIQWPLPDGSSTGSGGANGQSGALGMGQQASTGLGLFNTFFAYLMPLFGAYIADAHLGRYKTIHIAIVIGVTAHVILTAAAAPSVIVNKNGAFAAFIVGLLVLCVGTGFFKANISPLLAEQNQDTRMRVEVRGAGERVVVDPAVTNSRIFLYFYLAINIGSLVGQISMVYVEKYYGFWLAFMLPTVLFLISPLVLFFNRKKYILAPPTGSVVSKAFHLIAYVMRGKWTLDFARMRRDFSWDVARPSNVPEAQRPAWMTYDDAWVDEVRRGLKACKVFLFLPLFHLAYNQMTSNLTSQAAVMTLNGVPNDIIQNLNPISIVIMIPIFDHALYPGLRKIGIHFTPIKRMATGFFFAAAGMVAAAVMQYYIYQLSPCGYAAADPECAGKTPINVWAQVLPYVLIGAAEIFTNATSLEYAYFKAPANMKSLVMSVNLFMSAFASAVGQAFTPLSADPLLVWNYTIIAILAFLGGVGFWFCFRGLDKEEDRWNRIAKSAYRGKDKDGGVEAEAEAGEGAKGPVGEKA